MKLELNKSQKKIALAIADSADKPITIRAGKEAHIGDSTMETAKKLHEGLVKYYGLDHFLKHPLW